MTVNGNAIKACCLKVRSILEAGVEVQLARYDVCEGGAPAGAEVVKGIPLSPEETAQRDELLFLCAQRGRKALLDQAAYTWFNRIVAIHFMEVRGWLPSGVRMFTRADGSAGSQAVDEALDLQMDGLEPMRVAELKASGDDEALFRYLFLLQCEQLHDCLPDVFEPVGSAMELLLPQGLLFKDGPVMHMVSDIPEEDWTDGVEIVGWMYQYYVSERKDEVFAGFKKGKKAERDDIAPATQLFTPNWIVRYLTENSLGRLWMLNRPGSKLTESMPYFVKPDEDHETEFKHVASPEEITVVDPACGSGHILVYAFDLLAKIYEEEGYRARDAARLILEKNLSGMEIDPRAAAMASFALTMKARELDSRFLRRGVKPRIAVLSRVEFEPEELQYIPNLSARPQLLDAVAHLDECGSLLTVTKDDMDALAGDLASLAGESTIFGGSAVEKLELMRAELEPLGRSYDVVVANPPYMGSSSLGRWMSTWVKKRYPEAYRDLCTSFIDRGFSLSRTDGYSAMVTMQSWMFLGSFERLRGKILRGHSISSMAHLGTRAFGQIAGEVVSTTATVFANAKSEVRGAYFRLVDMGSEAEKREGLLEALADPACGWFYRRDADTFKQIPGSPIAYWVSQALISSFGKGIELDNISDYTGSQNITADNELYLRRWWEPSNSGNRWIPYSKGGNFRRWFGNHEYVVDWSEQAKYFYKNNSTSNLLNERYWFQEGITYSDITSGRSHFRFLPAQGVFDKKGPEICMLGKNLFSILAFLNSSVCQQYLYLLNPSMTLQVVDVKKLPLLKQIFDSPIINGLTKGNINLSCSDWDSFEISWDFKRNPLV